MGQMAEKKHSDLEVDDTLYEFEERLGRLNPASHAGRSVVKLALAVIGKGRSALMWMTTPTEELWPPKK